jgi:hypothetical protein
MATGTLERSPDELGSSVMQIATDPSFWLLVFVFVQGCGCSLAFVNNVGQFADSLGGAGANGKNVAVASVPVFFPSHALSWARSPPFCCSWV